MESDFNQISLTFFFLHVILIPLTFCEPLGFKERWKGTVAETDLLDEIASTVETDRNLGLRRSEFELRLRISGNARSERAWTWWIKLNTEV
jgi:hypothetical protein